MISDAKEFINWRNSFSILFFFYQNSISYLLFVDATIQKCSYNSSFNKNLTLIHHSIGDVSKTLENYGSQFLNNTVLVAFHVVLPMYVCLKCNTKKIASHCCQLSAAGCSVGHRMFVFGPTRTGVSKKFWANVQTKEKVVLRIFVALFE